MAPTWTTFFFFLRWKLLAELAHSVFSLFFLFYCLEQKAVLPTYYKLDLTIIAESLKNFLSGREQENTESIRYALQRPKGIAGEETQLFSITKRKVSHIKLGKPSVLKEVSASQAQ